MAINPSEFNKIPSGTTPQTCYKRILEWHRKRGSQLIDEKLSAHTQYKKDYKAYIKARKMHAFDPELFKEQISGLLEWAYHERDPYGIKLGAYAHYALNVKNKTFINSRKSSMTMGSRVWEYFDKLRGFRFNNALAKEVLAILVAQVHTDFKCASVSRVNKELSKISPALQKAVWVGDSKANAERVSVLREAGQNDIQTIIRRISEESWYDCVNERAGRELGVIIDVPSDSNIVHLNGNYSNILAEIVRKNKIRGEVHIVCPDPVQLMTAYLRVSKYSKKIFIHLGQPLQQDLWKNPFDVVLATPPLGLKDQNDYHYTQLALKLLKENGKYLLLTAAKLLFGKKEESDTRRILLDEMNLQAIFSIKDLLRPKTAINMALTVASIEPSCGDYVFVAEFSFHPSLKEESSQVFDAFREFKNGGKPSSSSPLIALAHREDLVNDFHVRRFNPLLNKFEKDYEKRFKITTISEYFKVIPGNFSYSRKLHGESSAQEGVPLLRIQDLQDGSIIVENARKVPVDSNRYERTRVGDVLFSASGTIGKTAVVWPGEEGLLVSRGIVILRPLEGYDPFFLNIVLQTSFVAYQLEGLSAGAVISRVSGESLKRLRIPVVEYKKQKQITNRVKQLKNRLKKLREEQSSIQEQLANVLDDIGL